MLDLFHYIHPLMILVPNNSISYYTCKHPIANSSIIKFVSRYYSQYYAGIIGSARPNAGKGNWLGQHNNNNYIIEIKNIAT